MQPLAIVFYERLMPGSQLVNRLQDSGYRVLSLNNASQLAITVQREMPMLVFVDLEGRGDIIGAISRIKSSETTMHVPVIAFAPDQNSKAMTASQSAGANFVVGETTLAGHLNNILDQALHLD